MKIKKVSDSWITMVQQMAQTDANLSGNVHGGTIMKLIDNTAGIVAARHAGRPVATASIDKLDFHAPVHVGDIVRFKASVNFVGRTSMEVGVRVDAENFITGESRHAVSAYLIMVGLDEQGKPAEVPQITFETDDQRRRNLSAIERRKKQNCVDK